MSGPAGPAATKATKALDALGIRWVGRPYAQGPSGDGFGLDAARALGVPPERVFKTLVAEADGALVVGVVPVTATLDLKALAAAVGAKRAAMADPGTAERRTGYVVGGISPFGRRTPAPLVLDGTAARFPTVFVSGGRRGFDIEIAPADLLAATGGTTAAIGVPK